MSKKIDYGEQIKQVREKYNFTQQKLADSLGIRQSMVAMIERGSRKATMDMAQSIADVLGCSITELYGDGTNAGEQPATA